MENFRVSQAAYQRGLESRQRAITPLPDYSLLLSLNGQGEVVENVLHLVLGQIRAM